MKATGIVRRIDDLGRVVIPKEIRRTLKIREGEPLEIFTDRNGEVILKKYAPINDLGIYAQEYCDVLADTLQVIAIVSDDLNIIAVAGGLKKEFLGQKLGSIKQTLQQKQVQTTKGTIVENGREFDTIIVAPIYTDEIIGSVIIAPKKEGQSLGETEKNLASTAARFLTKQMQKTD
jgi:AbrB family transcriptional regulator (stage V sporulation protein T)